LVAATWFSQKARGTANTVVSTSSPLGFAVGSAALPFLCPTVDDLPRTLLIIAIVATVAPIPLLFLPSAPPTPPGPVARVHADHASFFADLKRALQSPGFPVLLIAFATLVGVFTAFGALMTGFLGPEGYSSQQAGILGAVAIGGGLLGAGVMAQIIDRTESHIAMLKTLLPFAAIALFVNFFIVKLHNYSLLLASFFFIGLTTFGLFPAALEVGVECTYPCGESTSTALLMMAAQAAALLLQTTMNLLRAENGDMSVAALVAGGVAVLAALIGLRFNGTLRRRAAERMVQEAAKPG